MNSNIRDIINNKLHNFKYLNFTIAFYIIFFYTYYSLFAYLLDKNYIMLLLYFIFFILFYSVHKNFTYFIGFIILITLKIFNIDNILNNSSIKLLNKISNNKIENYEDDSYSALMRRVDSKADSKKNELENDDDPENNPCKTYIVKKVEEAGFKISSNSHNTDKKKNSTASDIDSMWSGMENVEKPTYYRLA